MVTGPETWLYTAGVLTIAVAALWLVGRAAQWLFDRDWPKWR